MSELTDRPGVRDRRPTAQRRKLRTAADCKGVRLDSRGIVIGPWSDSVRTLNARYRRF